MSRSAFAGNWRSVALSSCRQTMSGCSRSSHSSRFGSRVFTPLMLNVAIFTRLARRGQQPEQQGVVVLRGDADRLLQIRERADRGLGEHAAVVAAVGSVGN